MTEEGHCRLNSLEKLVCYRSEQCADAGAQILPVSSPAEPGEDGY
jgi:hypothetical protein